MSQTPHLDAERLAALIDGTLPRAERMAMERHAADCGECLQLLAAMVRTEPAPAHQGWRVPALAKWAVPLTAAATAVALWINAERQVPAPQRVVAEKQATPTPERTTDSVTPAPKPPGSARAGNAAAAPSARMEAKQAAKEQTRRHVAEQDRVRKLEDVVQPVPPPAAATPSVAAVPTGAAAVRPDATPPSPSAPSPAPVAEPLLPNAENEGRAAFSVARRAEAPEFEFASPDPLIRWRVRGVTISRSLDGGKTWPSAVAAFHTAARAGTSPSPQVAWIVGRQGLVMRTIDGLTWIRAGTPGPLDLIAVRATSGLEADVTAADGRVFRTTDGGRTWTAQDTR